MTNDERYNGWTNRETWAVALHITNDEGWQESVHEAIREAVAMSDEVTPSKAGEIIRDNVEGVLDGDEYDNHATALAIAKDIGSLWRVDWREIGEAFLADATEQGA